MTARSRTKALLLALLMLLAFLVSACGGSSDPEPLTKAEFFKQGNETCAEVAPQQRAAVESFDGSEAGEGEMEEVVAAALGPVKDMAGELSSLEGPPAATKAVKVYVAQLEAAIAKAEAKPASAVSGTAFMQANVAAERAGLPACVI